MLIRGGQQLNHTLNPNQFELICTKQVMFYLETCILILYIYFLSITLIHRDPHVTTKQSLCSPIAHFLLQRLHSCHCGCVIVARSWCDFVQNAHGEHQSTRLCGTERPPKLQQPPPPEDHAAPKRRRIMCDPAAHEPPPPHVAMFGGGRGRKRSLVSSEHVLDLPMRTIDRR